MAARGTAALTQFDGPFALAHWTRSARALLIGRDALGLAQLYLSVDGRTLRVSNSLDAFSDRPFDRQYLAAFILGRGNPATRLTIRAGVSALGPGDWLRWQDGHITTGTFWSPATIAPRHMRLADAASEFRSLVEESVRRSLDEDSGTWAHLSGGLDSSSVVSMAGSIARVAVDAPRLAGTLMLSDSLGNADETEFADAIRREYAIPHIGLSDYWPWQHDAAGPPVTHRPTRDYPYYARDRAVVREVRGRGGRAMLSGFGPDVYLPNSTAHCPDLIWEGRWTTAARELHAAAVSSRRSFWRVTVDDGIVPLCSGRKVAVKRPKILTRWLRREFARAEVEAYRRATDCHPMARGTFYQAQVCAGLDSVSEWLPDWLYSPGLPIRHPLMWRPLVEFALSLPYDLRTDVYWSKPILRTGMKGILPEKVRLRVGKSIIAPRIYWALRHERAAIETLLDHSMLAELGCVEPSAISQSLNSFDVYNGSDAAFLYALLSLETWLSVKSGRWPTLGNPSSQKENNHGTAAPFSEHTVAAAPAH